MSEQMHVGLWVGGDPSGGGHCNAALQCLVSLLLQLGVTRCLEALYAQHFKEVYPISLDVLWHSPVGDNCVPWSLRQQTPCP